MSLRRCYQLDCINTITSHRSHGHPSVPHAAPAPFPPTQIVHVIHHSKHHSSSKNKHHHKHSGHDHGHSHSHSHSQHHLPSPSQMTSFPITPSTSYPPQINFPTVPYRPPIQSSSSNILRKLPSPGYMQSIPPPKQSTKHIPKHLHKPNYLSIPHHHTASPTGPPINHDFQYSNCTGRRRALCVCSPKSRFNPFELASDLFSFFFFIFRSALTIVAKRTN